MTQSSLVMITLLILCAINAAFCMAMGRQPSQVIKPLAGVSTKTTIRDKWGTYLVIMASINIICLMLLRTLIQK